MLVTNPEISQLVGLGKLYHPLPTEQSIELVKLMTTTEKVDDLPDWARNHLATVKEMIEQQKTQSQEVTNMKTPMERLKYAMNCMPMKSADAAEAYLKIASMCKSFDEMPIPMQNYITQAEEEFGYEAPESMV